MEQIQHRQENTHNGQIKISNLHSHGGFLRCTGDKTAQDQFSEQEHGGGDSDGGGQGDQKRGAHPLADTLIFSCAQVLAYIGNHGVAVRGGGDFQNAVQLIAGGISGDKDDAKAVDDKLKDHAAHGNDAVLERHGSA